MLPVQTTKLVTLQEAAVLLSVPVSTLLTWNDYHILKPTITQAGEIGYTKEQIDRFLKIQQSFRGNQTSEQTPRNPAKFIDPITEIQQQPTQTATNSFALIENRAEPFIAKAKMSLKAHEQHARHSKFFMPSFAIITSIAFLILIGKGIATSLTTEVTTKQNQTGGNALTSTQTSKLALTQSVNSSLDLQDQEMRNKSIAASSETSIFRDEKAQYLFTKKKIASAPVPAYGKNFIATASAIKFARLPSNDAVLAASQTGVTSLSSVSTINEPQADSAIDVGGNISGESKQSAIATILGGVEGVSSNPPQFNSDQKTQVILLSIFSVGIWFALKKPRHRLQASSLHEPTTTQRAFEVDQKMDGTIVVCFQNKEYKVSKPELYSDSDRFIERLLALSQDIKELDYDNTMDDTISLTTPLSRLVTRLGFVGIKRDLFFPRTSKNRVLFRRFITLEDLAAMNLTLSDIAADLTIQPALG